MKKMIEIIAILSSLAILSTSVSAYNYNFSSGADSKMTFDKATQSDEFVTANPYENVRNNKDSAYSPPPYGVFSGDIPTGYASPYHEQDDKPSTVGATSGVSYSAYPSGENGVIMPEISELSYAADGEILPSTSLYSENAKILPLYYDDNSIGTLEFPQFNRTIKVYEGESLENMRLGAGHFSGTSAWDGNCAVAAHNRGVPNNFDFLKNMDVGDVVKYTTKYGERTYKVVEKMQISVEDTTVLEWSADNILTLVTCVEGVPELRHAVICRAVS